VVTSEDRRNRTYDEAPLLLSISSEDTYPTREGGSNAVLRPFTIDAWGFNRISLR